MQNLLVVSCAHAVENRDTATSEKTTKNAPVTGPFFAVAGAVERLILPLFSFGCPALCIRPSKEMWTHSRFGLERRGTHWSEWKARDGTWIHHDLDKEHPHRVRYRVDRPLSIFNRRDKVLCQKVARGVVLQASARAGDEGWKGHWRRWQSCRRWWLHW